MCAPRPRPGSLLPHLIEKHEATELRGREDIEPAVGIHVDDLNLHTNAAPLVDQVWHELHEAAGIAFELEPVQHRGGAGSTSPLGPWAHIRLPTTRSFRPSPFKSPASSVRLREGDAIFFKLVARYP